MTTEVKTVKTTESVSDVLKLMFKHRHMGYPVYQDGNLQGIVTFHDLSDIPQEQRNSPVENFMTRDLVVTSPEEEVSTTLEKLNMNNVGRLPVLQDGRLVGIISKTDVIKALEIRKTRFTNN